MQEKLKVNLFKLVLDNLPDAILIVDAERRVVYRNDKFLNMWRIPPEAVLTGAKAHHLVEQLADQLEKPEAFKSRVESLYSGGEDSQDELNFRDGRVFRRRSMALSENGSGHSRVWIFTEITDIRKAQAAVSERDAWQQVIFSSMGEGLIAHRILEDGRPGPFEYVNPVWCHNLGYSREEISHLSPSEIDDPDIGSRVIPEVMATLKRSGSARFESIQLRKDGSRIPVAVHARVFSFRGQTWIISIVNDISEQKARERELHDLISRLEKMNAEIKTLRGILPICAFCKKIRDDKGYWKQLEEYIQNHSAANFSHGICPECMKEHYPELCDEQEE